MDIASEVPALPPDQRLSSARSTAGGGAGRLQSVPQHRRDRIARAITSEDLYMIAIEQALQKSPQDRYVESVVQRKVPAVIAAGSLNHMIATIQRWAKVMKLNNVRPEGFHDARKWTQMTLFK
jgi:hypothetical protein